MLLDVHYNLNRGGLTTLRVRDGGWRRAVEEGVRNVHAFCRGDTELDIDTAAYFSRDDRVDVRYNPFVRGEFFIPQNGKAILSAELVVISDKSIIAFGAIYPAVHYSKSIDIQFELAPHA